MNQSNFREEKYVEMHPEVAKNLRSKLRSALIYIFSKIRRFSKKYRYLLSLFQYPVRNYKTGVIVQEIVEFTIVYRCKL